MRTENRKQEARERGRVIDIEREIEIEIDREIEIERDIVRIPKILIL